MKKIQKIKADRKTIVMSIIALFVVMLLIQTGASALPIFNSDNGHYYDIVVSQDTISWLNANAAAQTSTYESMAGHLGTITSAEEFNWLTSHFDQPSNNVWLGGQNDPSSSPDGWEWVTGEPWGYTNWASGQPDGSSSVSQYLYYDPAADGNPANDGEDENPETNNYLVEYESELQTTATPEPMSMLLMASGLAGLGFMRRKKVV